MQGGQKKVDDLKPMATCEKDRKRKKHTRREGKRNKMSLFF